MPPVWASPALPRQAAAASDSRLPPRATSSLVNNLEEKWNQKAIGNYYELFAASLGNLEWLRFCLDRHGEVIPADDKVRTWRARARTEVLSTPRIAPHIVVAWPELIKGHWEIPFSGERVLTHLVTAGRLFGGVWKVSRYGSGKEVCVIPGLGHREEGKGNRRNCFLG